jgi:hypothetical protein
MAESLLKALTHREEGDEVLAQQLLDDMIELVQQGEDPEQVLFDEGLEPDYVMDLLIYK